MIRRRKLPRPSYKAGKAPPANSKTPVLFRFKNDFLKRIDAAAKKQELPRQAWVRTVIAEALEPKGFESEIMTSKLNELLGRQLFTPFVITTEDGDLISISNPPVRVFRSLREQLTHHTRTVLRGN